MAKIQGIKITPKWEWSAWYRTNVSQMLASPKAPGFDARKNGYIEWLQAERGMGEEEALEYATDQGYAEEPLTAEQCRFEEPAGPWVQFVKAETPDEPEGDPRPAKVGGITIQPRWHWSKLYRQHVGQQWADLGRRGGSLPMKRERAST